MSKKFKLTPMRKLFSWIMHIPKAINRKLFVALSIAFCLSIFFGENLILFSAGSCAKFYFRFHKGWEFDYQSIQWINRKLIFTDLFLKNETDFSIRAPLVSISIASKHLEAVAPSVLLYRIPEAANNDAWHWSCSIQNGTIEGAGLERSSFSFDMSPVQNQMRLRVDFEESSLILDSCSQSGATMIDVHLQDVYLSSLGAWMGNRWNGMVQGSLHFIKEGNLWTSCGGCLEGKNIGFEGLIEGVFGSLDWEGLPELFDLSDVHSPLDFQSALDKGHLRLSILDGNIFLNRGRGEKLQSSLSFEARSGAKWEFSVFHQGQKIEGSGRGFLHSLKERWMESELHCGEGSLALQGHERGGHFIYDFKANQLDRNLLSFLQDIASYTEIIPSGWVIRDGVLSGLAQMVCGKNGTPDWKIFNFCMDNLALEIDTCCISCKRAELNDEVYSFHEGSLVASKGIAFLDWEGKFHRDSGRAEVTGKIGDLAVYCESEKFSGSFLEENRFQARLKKAGKIDGDMMACAQWKDGSLHFTIEEGTGSVFSFARIEQLCLTGEANSEGISCFDVRGICDLGKKVPFYCPVIQTHGAFDIRFETPILQLIRFAGTIEKQKILWDPNRSHFCGVPISFSEASFSEIGLESLHTQCGIPWKLFPFFFEDPSSLSSIFTSGEVSCHFSYEKENGAQIELSGDMMLQGETSSFLLNLQSRESEWRLNSSRMGNSCVEGLLSFREEGICLTEGKGRWSEQSFAEFTGKLLAIDNWSLNISHLHFDLTEMGFFKDLGLLGIMEGEGLIHWQGGLESDFDLVGSQLSLNDFPLENREPLHLFCSSKKGVFVRGINISLLQKEVVPSIAECKVGLLQYDLEQSLFVLTQCQLHLSSECIDRFALREKIRLNQGESLYLTGDIASTFDFSHITCSMKEANLPLKQGSRRAQNLHFELGRKECRANFYLDHQDQMIPVDVWVQSNVDLYQQFLPRSFYGLIPGSLESPDPLSPLEIKGRCIIENGMKIDGIFTDRWKVETIEGRCMGMDASFHWEDHSLIGSAKFNCNEFIAFLPSDIAQVFKELKMGDGYELMGRVFMEEEGLLFKGILSGKQIELFGFQLRNLLGQIELSSDHVHISDLKISDFAGVLKIDQILAQGVGTDPWTISIPRLTVTEFRPSLLQDVGGPPGKLSPLVIRTLEIRDFKGFVQDSNTYTAQGELFFINSYKREKSILEIPSDVLSRIVGLDLDLMIPVCGTLRYELRDGLFHFTELVGSYSENKRSEFFLVYNEGSPTMDLDWNLNILIQMKQFVIFKFTESFIISVNGKLDDPKFHLQRKKRFLGI